ncbi:MAG: sugar transferase [Candidatus Sericytochromatia bacterium]|nr:sugar transferase [Candidatus Sericytochromatia bacterium]
MRALIDVMGCAPAFGPPGEACPPGLLPLAGRPLVAGLVGWLEAQGAEAIQLLLRERPHGLVAHFEAHPPARARLQHVLAGRPTAPWWRHLDDPSVLLCRGSLVTDVALGPLLATHAAVGTRLTVLLAPRPGRPAGPGLALDGAGQVHVAADGPLMAAGVALAAPRLLAGLADEARAVPPDGALLAAALAAGEPVAGVVAEGFWCDASLPGGWAEALAAVLAGRVAGWLPVGEAREPGIWVAPGAHIDPRARLVAPCHVGAGARVGPDAEVGPLTSVEAGAEVERGARIAACGVLPGTRIGAGTRWRERLLYPHGALAWRLPDARPEPSDDPTRLGDTWRPSLRDRAHVLLDQALAGLGLLALTPLLAAIALAIRLDSPGPALFVQLRAGQDRRPSRPGLPRAEVFPCFKFRTMHLDAEARVEALRASNQYGGGAFFKLEDDPRITRVGRWLRHTSLDELPQLLNVLRGEMRLVGNRPLPLYEAEALTEDWQRARFLAPAGITGLWQISGRSELSERERLALDALYAATRTFWGDVTILLRTVPALLARRGAR